MEEGGLQGLNPVRVLLLLLLLLSEMPLSCAPCISVLPPLRAASQWTEEDIDEFEAFNAGVAGSKPFTQQEAW